MAHVINVLHRGAQKSIDPLEVVFVGILSTLFLYLLHPQHTVSPLFVLRWSISVLPTGSSGSVPIHENDC
jgi:hypothetical protein